MIGAPRLRLRTKLLLVVGTTAVVLLFLLVSGEFISRDVTRQLATIQAKYIPFLELGPRLETGVERLHRAFQDAVAAQDLTSLDATIAQRDALLQDLDASHETLDPRTLTALKESLKTYHATAYNVAWRWIQGETGVSFVEAVGDMQNQYGGVIQSLQQTTRFDNAKLKEAFALADDTLATAARAREITSLACLIVVVLLLLSVNRGILASVSELNAGLSRFGRGDFDTPVGVLSQDELGAVAAHANDMARRIRGLLREREAQAQALEIANKELEAFSYSVAHDLRAPLRGVIGYGNILIEDYGNEIPDEARKLLDRIVAVAKRMGQLIDGLLGLSRLARQELVKGEVDMSKLAKEVLNDLLESAPERDVVISIADDLKAEGDAKLLYVMLANLLGNAWKFTSKTPTTKISVGEIPGDEGVFFVRDNGAGFDMRYADKLFGAFHRLHGHQEFEGTGIGLATVQRIVGRHGGRIWAESTPGEGTTFYFTLGKTEEESSR